MKRRNRRTALFLVAVMAISLLTSCSGSKKGNEKQSTDTIKDKTKITWCTYTQSGSDDEGTIVEQELEKAFPDVDFKFWVFEQSNYSDQLGVKIAGGEIPDMLRVKSSTDCKTLVRQGVLAEVSLDTLKEYAPDYFEAVKEKGMDSFLACAVNGKNYGFPTLNVYQQYPNTDAWRKDWLDKVGITKVPETIGEMEQAFDKFVNDDPDGNGKKDTYAVSAVGKTNTENIFGSVFGAYGIFLNKFMMQPDGTLTLGILNDKVKEPLALLNKWYEAGYIDPEFITTSVDAQRSKWYNGRVGYYDVSQWKRLMPNGIYVTTLKSSNPKAEVVMAPPIKGPYGDYGYYGWSKISASDCFGSHLEKNKEKLIKAIQIRQKTATDPLLARTIAYGIEGVHWKKNEITGGIEFTPEFLSTDSRISLGTNMMISLETPKMQLEDIGNDIEQYSKYSQMSTKVQERDYFEWPRIFADEEIMNIYYDQLRPITSKWTIHFITGTKPISAYDDFIKEWKAAGGDKVVEEINRAYKEGKAVLESYKEKN